MPTLTKKQKQILDFITSYINKKGLSPTIEEIRKHFKLSALSTVHQHVETLKKKGFIEKNGSSARGIIIRKKISTIKDMIKRQDKILEMFPNKQQKLINEAIAIEYKLTMIEQGYNPVDVDS